MTQRPLSIALRLAFFSFLVGALLSFLDLTPWEMLRDIGGTVRSITDFILEAVRWAAPTIILGAIVVVPIWLAIRAWKLLRGR